MISIYNMLAAKPTKPTGGNMKRATSVAMQKNASQGIKIHSKTIFVVLFMLSPPYVFNFILVLKITYTYQ